MPVVHFEEVSGRDESRNLDTEQRATRTFEVYTDFDLDGSHLVRAFDQLVTPFPAGAPGAEHNGKPQRRVPRVGDKFVVLDENWSVVAGSTKDHVVCVEVRVEQTDRDDCRKWTVVCQYAGVDDPLAQPADVSWDNTPYQVALLAEAEALDPNPNPRPILNSAGDPFAEGVMADRRRFTVTIVKNTVNWSPAAAAPYQDSVNSGTFLGAQHPPGFEAGTCKLNISAQRIRRSSNTDFYWRVKALVEINLDKWDAKVRDAGFRYIHQASGKKLPISQHPQFVENGAPTSPIPLKPNGDVALPADPLPDPLTFRVYKRKDWGPLNLEY